jgi:hypothetical protein
MTLWQALAAEWPELLISSIIIIGSLAFAIYASIIDTE